MSVVVFSLTVIFMFPSLPITHAQQGWEESFAHCLHVKPLPYLAKLILVALRLLPSQDRGGLPLLDHSNSTPTHTRRRNDDKLLVAPDLSTLSHSVVLVQRHPRLQHHKSSLTLANSYPSSAPA